jgi:uncharacterized DUF497 family protein
MKIYFTNHAKEQLEKRVIKVEDVEFVLENPDNIYYDLKEGNFVAVKKIDNKLLIVIFEEVFGCFKVISAIKSSKLNLPENRVKRGRWIEV